MASVEKTHYHGHHTPLGNNYEVLDDPTQLLLLFDHFDEIVGPTTSSAVSTTPSWSNGMESAQTGCSPTGPLSRNSKTP